MIRTKCMYYMLFDICISSCTYIIMHIRPAACIKLSFSVVNIYSGTSLLRSPTGLGKSDLIGEVTLLQGVICTVEYNLGLSQSDCNWEVFLLVR